MAAKPKSENKNKEKTLMASYQKRDRVQEILAESRKKPVIRQLIKKELVDRESKKPDPIMVQGIIFEKKMGSLKIKDPESFRQWQLKNNPWVFVVVLQNHVTNYLEIVDPHTLNREQRKEVFTFKMRSEWIFEQIDAYIQKGNIPFAGIYQEFKIRMVVGQIEREAMSRGLGFVSGLPDRPSIYPQHKNHVRTLTLK